MLMDGRETRDSNSNLDHSVCSSFGSALSLSWLLSHPTKGFCWERNGHMSRIDHAQSTNHPSTLVTPAKICCITDITIANLTLGIASQSYWPNSNANLAMSQLKNKSMTWRSARRWSNARWLLNVSGKFVTTSWLIFMLFATNASMHGKREWEV
jgi:hypothetical protein